MRTRHPIFVHMLAAIRSAALLGIDAFSVTVEVDAALGLPQWTMVGLPANAVKESRERVNAALVNSGFSLPPRRVTTSLAPCDIKKDGTAYDLPIAIGLLVATGQLAPESVAHCVFVGELGLDGRLRPIRGALPIARSLGNLTQHVSPTLVLPPDNVAEAQRVATLRIAAPATLAELVHALRANTLPLIQRPSITPNTPPSDVGFSDVAGQLAAKRALEVAAAGGHNVLLSGPPGAGKTMLARRLPTILPPLTDHEALEVIAIHSVAGTLTDAITHGARPFRAPHHTTSGAGLIGGGSTPKPGEISLAHLGVLFLDEMPEFPRSILDALRQPLEDAHVTIARASMTVAFPARFTLVAAMNPCPCGRNGDGSGRCTCTPREVALYAARISGPLLDRIDMRIHVGAISMAELSSDANATPSAVIRERVQHARIQQRDRYRAIRSAKHTSFEAAPLNAHAPGRWLDTHTPVTPDARHMLHTAADTLQLSARAYHRVLKVSRTIADLDGERAIGQPHVAEALRYRAATHG